MSLTLADAIKTDRLQEFVDQEEARNIGILPVNQFDSLIKAAVKLPRLEDRTSRSSSRGGSRGR